MAQPRWRKCARVAAHLDGVSGGLCQQRQQCGCHPRMLQQRAEQLRGSWVGLQLQGKVCRAFRLLNWSPQVEGGMQKQAELSCWPHCSDPQCQPKFAPCCPAQGPLRWRPSRQAHLAQLRAHAIHHIVGIGRHQPAQAAAVAAPPADAADCCLCCRADQLRAVGCRHRKGGRVRRASEKGWGTLHLVPQSTGASRAALAGQSCRQQGNNRTEQVGKQ